MADATHPLYAVFQYYAGGDRKSPALDVTQFIRLCRECGVLDPVLLDRAQAELCFVRARPRGGGATRLHFGDFTCAVRALGKAREPTLDAHTAGQRIADALAHTWAAQDEARAAERMAQLYVDPVAARTGISTTTTGRRASVGGASIDGRWGGSRRSSFASTSTSAGGGARAWPYPAVSGAVALHVRQPAARSDAVDGGGAPASVVDAAEGKGAHGEGRRANPPPRRPVGYKPSTTTAVGVTPMQPRASRPSSTTRPRSPTLTDLVTAQRTERLEEEEGQAQGALQQTGYQRKYPPPVYVGLDELPLAHFGITERAYDPDHKRVG